MERDFDRWNKLKKAINASDESERVYFHEGDIWWARVGVNIGFAMDRQRTMLHDKPLWKGDGADPRLLAK